MIASRGLFDRVAQRHQSDLRPRPRRARPGHRRIVPDQGRRRLEGRARRRAAPHPQLRPHRRPRARSRDEVPALPHGEAIAYGMLAAADLAVARGALADRERQALAQLITLLGPLPPIGDLSIAEVLEAVAPRQEGRARTAALRHCDRNRRHDDRGRRDGRGITRGAGAAGIEGARPSRRFRTPSTSAASSCS